MEDPWQKKILVEFQKSEKNDGQFKSQVVLQPGEAWVDPKNINYSQESVYIYYDHLKILDTMQKNGWDERYSLEVVKIAPNIYISIDNRRLFMAKLLKLDKIKVKIHQKYDQDIDTMKVRFREQYSEEKDGKICLSLDKHKRINELRNWSDCLQFRMENQNNGPVPLYGFKEFILVKDRIKLPQWYVDILTQKAKL